MAAGWVAVAHLGPAIACTAFTTLSAWAAARESGQRRWRRRALAASVAMMLAQVSTGSLNDVADRRADRIHQPYKPIAQGRVSTTGALTFALGTGLGSLLIAAGCGRRALRIMSLGLASGWSYDLWLRRTPGSGVPFLVGIATVPLLGPAAVGASPVRPRFLTAMAGLLGVGLHLANSGPDVDRDRLAGRRSLAVLLGNRGSRLGTHAILTGAAVLAVAGSDGRGRMPATTGAALGLALLGADRLAMSPRRDPGGHPFVLPVLAAAAVAGGWLVGSVYGSASPQLRMRG